MDWYELDCWLFEWAYGLDLHRPTVQAVTYLAAHGGVWLLAGVGLTAFGRGRARRTGLAVMTGLLVHVALIEGLLKHAVARTRPFAALGVELRDGLLDPDSYSFPSGHTVASFCAAWILGVAFPRARLPALGLAVGIAASRPVLGAHYPSDVLVGALLGLGLGAALSRLFRVAPSDSEVEAPVRNRAAT